jgi:hypothetical protein
MKLKKLLAGHLLILTLVFPYTVFAEDFTFNVPVEASNLHQDVDRIKVICEIEGIPESGEKILNVPANGIINETVQIKFDIEEILTDSQLSQKARACKLAVSKPGVDFINFIRSGQASCNLTANHWRCAKEGETFTDYVEGPIGLPDNSGGN